MKEKEKCGKVMVTGGWVACPVCRVNRKLIHIRPDTVADHLELYCRKCKHSVLVKIQDGACYEIPAESQSLQGQSRE